LDLGSRTRLPNLGSKIYDLGSMIQDLGSKIWELGSRGWSGLAWPGMVWFVFLHMTEEKSSVGDRLLDSVSHII